ncbi:Transcription intermediary factor 1-alpha [Mactra antiquata]
MAFSGSILKTSEETFDFICTSCAEDNLIKEALKYCVECQKYCCKDCLTSHRRFALLKGHTFLDNSSVKLQGQPSSLPAFPTKQCSQHIGKIMDMFCKTHDVVCCYVCAAEDHK